MHYRRTAPERRSFRCGTGRCSPPHWTREPASAQPSRSQAETVLRRGRVPHGRRRHGRPFSHKLTAPPSCSPFFLSPQDLQAKKERDLRKKTYKKKNIASIPTGGPVKRARANFLAASPQAEAALS